MENRAGRGSSGLRAYCDRSDSYGIRRVGRGSYGQRAVRGVLKEAECSLKREHGVGENVCVGLSLVQAMCIMNWPNNPCGFADPARRDHDRVGVAGGRAIRLHLTNAGPALRALLRVHSTYCLLERPARKPIVLG